MTSLREILAAILVVASTATALAEAPAPKTKTLETPEDPAQKTVLIGEANTGEMLIKLEIEAAKGMWMRMGSPPKWVEHRVTAGDIYHVEVKPTDVKSKTRVAYAKVSFDATNTATGKKISLVLHPMWGGSGLHYALNSALAGDGAYSANVTVGVPDFARADQDQNLFSKPATAQFHFKLANRKIVEVSEFPN